MEIIHVLPSTNSGVQTQASFYMVSQVIHVGYTCMSLSKYPFLYVQEIYFSIINTSKDTIVSILL